MRAISVASFGGPDVLQTRRRAHAGTGRRRGPRPAARRRREPGRHLHPGGHLRPQARPALHARHRWRRRDRRRRAATSSAWRRASACTSRAVLGRALHGHLRRARRRARDRRARRCRPRCRSRRARPSASRTRRRGARCSRRPSWRPGETVLVHGASGGVGLAAVQMAARARRASCIGTAGTEAGRELVRSEGAHRVFDHRAASYVDEILAFTGGHGVDVVLEMLANVNLERSLGMLAPARPRRGHRQPRLARVQPAPDHGQGSDGARHDAVEHERRGGRGGAGRRVRGPRERHAAPGGRPRVRPRRRAARPRGGRSRPARTARSSCSRESRRTVDRGRAAAACRGEPRSPRPLLAVARCSCCRCCSARRCSIRTRGCTPPSRRRWSSAATGSRRACSASRSSTSPRCSSGASRRRSRPSASTSSRSSCRACCSGRSAPSRRACWPAASSAGRRHARASRLRDACCCRSRSPRSPCTTSPRAVDHAGHAGAVRRRRQHATARATIGLGRARRAVAGPRGADEGADRRRPRRPAVRGVVPAGPAACGRPSLARGAAQPAGRRRRGRAVVPRDGARQPRLPALLLRRAAPARLRHDDAAARAAGRGGTTCRSWSAARCPGSSTSARRCGDVGRPGGRGSARPRRARIELLRHLGGARHGLPQHGRARSWSPTCCPSSRRSPSWRPARGRVRLATRAGAARSRAGGRPRACVRLGMAAVLPGAAIAATMWVGHRRAGRSRGRCGRRWRSRGWSWPRGRRDSRTRARWSACCGRMALTVVVALGRDAARGRPGVHGARRGPPLQPAAPPARRPCGSTTSAWDRSSSTSTRRCARALTPGQVVRARPELLLALRHAPADTDIVVPSRGDRRASSAASRWPHIPRCSPVTIASSRARTSSRPCGRRWTVRPVAARAG